MPILRGGRLLKRWRYIGAFGPDLMLCAGLARIGPTIQSWWAIWDREDRCLRERTRPGHGGVRFARGRALVDDEDVRIELEWPESPGVEVVTPDGPGYAWTRKQGGVEMAGSVSIAGAKRPFEAGAVIDDSAGYHARRTAWRWSAGVGTVADGRPVAWNLVAGVHDDPRASERTVWVGSEPHEVGRVRFVGELDGIALAEPETADGGAGALRPGAEATAGHDDEFLRFSAEATRERHDNLLLFRSDYVQPFGTFTGTLPGAVELREGYGVMESHDVRW